MNGDGLDWQELQAFLTVADELHFGHAAERLHLSQARVSQMIKKLERRVGTTVFDRTTRRVRLTAVGQQLLEDLRPAHQAVLDSLTRAQAAGRGITGLLRVGFLGPLAGRVVLDVLNDLEVEHPEIELRLSETHIADPCQPLRDDEVDIVLTQLPVVEAGIATGPPVISESQVLAVSAKHPFAAQDHVRLEDLSDERVFRPAGSPPQAWLDSYLPWATPTGRPIERGPAVHTFQELLALVAAGQAVCPVAAHNVRYHPRSDVAFIPVVDAPPLQFGLAWLTGTTTARKQIFIEATHQFVHRRGGPIHQ